MKRLCSLTLCLTALVSSAAEEAKTPLTDLYGDPLPPGAVARLGTIRLRHAEADIAFSKDGKQLISCGCDGEVRVWDAATGRLLRRQRLSWKPAADECFYRMTLSPGGATAAAWNGKTVYLYDANTGKERGRLSSIAASSSSRLLLTFSADGQFLAVQKDDDKGRSIAQLWDVSDVKYRQNLQNPFSLELSRVAFAPDGKRLAGTTTSGGRLFLWDTATGKTIEKQDGRGAEEPWPLAFSPKGGTLAMGCDRQGRVRLLDAATQKEMALLKPPKNVHATVFHDLAFSPDGLLLAGTYSAYSSTTEPDYGVLLWDVAGVKEARRIPDHYGARLAFAPDGKILACHNEGSYPESAAEIRLWDAASGRPLHPRPGHDNPLEALAVAPDGKIVASGDAEGMLRLWDTASGKQLRLLKAHRGIASCLFSPDGKRLISTGQPDATGGEVTLQVWDVASGEQRRRIDIDPWVRRVYAAGISADGKRLAAAVSVDWRAPKPQLFVWDLATGKRLRKRPYKVKVEVSSIPFSGKTSTFFEAHAAFAPDGERVTVWLGNRVGIEDIATGCLLTTLPEDVGQPLVFSPNGRLLAAAIVQRNQFSFAKDKRKGLSLIETATGEEVVRLEIGEFAHFAFTLDGCGLIVADKKTLRVWNTDTGARLHQMVWPESIRDAHGEAKIHSLVALPGERAATGMTEGDILIWDLAPACCPVRKPLRDFSRAKRDALWTDLAGDARKAHRAAHMLTFAPVPAVALLRDHLHPVAETNRVEKLLADLDSDSFEARERASQELAWMGCRIEPMLRRLLKNKPSLEVRRRLEDILTGPTRPPAEALRTLRAIAVLEGIGTAEARRILENLSGGADAPETREAQATLQRLKRRDAWAKEKTSP